MEKLYGYNTFEFYRILEKADYEWDFDKGVEIDYRNNIVRSMKKSLSEAKDPKKWLTNLLERLRSKKTKLKIAILALLTPFIIHSTNLSQDDILNTAASVDPIGVEVFQKEFDKLEVSKKKFANLKDPAKMDASEKVIEFLKNEEKLELTAYAIGDTKITVGYGHAEDSLKSKYKVGDKISLKQADRLFRKDLRRTTKGVNRIFKQWQKEGVDVKLTQSQFDALVSMAYNMGIGGLRSSEFIQLVKQNKLEEAGERIKTTRLKKGFGGLVTRREKESEMFLRSI